jgi:predicted lysophospholipase L1 biosynthesis ABC-type transport system permease subunit
MLVTGVPVIVLLGMMLIVSWDQPVWDILLGALFLAALWAYVKLVKKTLARRRELRGEMQTGASSPMA